MQATETPGPAAFATFAPTSSTAPSASPTWESPALVQLNQRVNRKAYEARVGADILNFSPMEATKDAAEALPGIMEDVFGNSPSAGFVAIFSKNNRLRGLGWLLVVVALLGLCMYISLHMRMDVTTTGSHQGWSTAAPPPPPPIVLSPPVPVVTAAHPQGRLYGPGEGFAYAR